MKRTLGAFFVAVACIATESANMNQSFSLKSDPRAIEKEVLNVTPLGSALTTVERLCAKHKWRCSTSRDSGFLKQEDGKDWETVGNYFIGATLGEYQRDEHSIVSVSVFWGFDKTEKLIEVWVWKTVDAP